MSTDWKVRLHSIQQKLNDRIETFLNHTHDHFLCFLPGFLGIFRRFLLGFLFFRIKLDSQQAEHLKELEKKGILVYVNRNKSNFEYLFYHTRYQKEGLPFPEVGFDYRLWHWQPLIRLARMTVAKIDYLIKYRSWSNCYDSGYVGRALLAGHTGMVSLIEKKGFQRRFVKFRTDPIQYLIELQNDIDKPIYLVPQLMFLSKSPKRARKNVVDFLFGTEEEPGRLRRLLTMIRYYGRVFVEVSEPVELKSFLNEPDIRGLSSLQQSLTLRRRLLMQFNRHRQSITGPDVKSKLELKEVILTGIRLQEYMQNYAKEKNVAIRKVHKKANSYLEEIASNMSMTVLEMFSSFLTWVFNKMFDGVVYEKDEVRAVKQASQKANLIFVPSHKSHIDYLILSYILYQNKAACPQIAAGKNLSFWPLGPLFRGSGAFFLRRTFKGNPLYATVFREYVYKLLQEGSNIEFFVEGGRSRTGKLLRPKLGFLSILLDCYKNGACEKMLFVPTYIGCDRVPEESAYMDEVLGGKKEDENLSQVIGATRFLKQRYGKIYIRFSKPLDVASLLEAENKTLAAMSDDEMRLFSKQLGFNIINAIDRVSVITPHALVASAILNCGTARFSYDRIALQVVSYMNYLETTDVQLSDTLRCDYDHAIAHVLKSYVRQKLLEPLSQEPEKSIKEWQFKVPDNRRPLLEYYKNLNIAFFIAPAMTALTILDKDTSQFSSPDLHDRYKLLQNLLKKEFAYNADQTPEFQVRKSIKAFLNEGILLPHPALPDTYKITAEGFKNIEVYAMFLKSYLESYLVVLKQFSSCTSKALNPKEQLKKSQNLAKQMLKDGDIEMQESLSKVNFINAIEFFGRKGISCNEDLETIDYYRDIIQNFLKKLNFSDMSMKHTQ